MKHKGKRVLACLLAMGLALCCAGCSQQESTEGEPTRVLVGTDGATRPYTYYDENNELTGYDIAVVKAVDELLEDYTFEFEVTEFTSIFAGIDSGRYGMGANNISKNEEREEKYYFGNQYYLYNNAVIVVQKGRTDIQSLEDLSGKRTPYKPDGTYLQKFLDTYNEQHPDAPIDTFFTDQDSLKTYQDIMNGSVDFMLSEEIIIDAMMDEYNLDLDIIQLDHEEAIQVMNPEGYFIFPKTEEGEKLRDAVDGALQQLIEDGTLTRLSNEFLGHDYSPDKEQ